MTEYNFNELHRAAAQDVLDYFKKYPERHDQGAWYDIDEEALPNNWDEEESLAEYVPQNICKTTMCAAGTVMWQRHGVVGLKMFDVDNRFAQREAARLLGLEWNDANQLFHTMNEETVKKVLKRIAKGKKNIWKGTRYDY